MRMLVPIMQRVVPWTLPERLPESLNFAGLSRTALALVLSVAVAGLTGCDSGDGGNQAANAPGQGRGANNARDAGRGRPNIPRQAEAANASREQNEEENSHGGGDSKPDRRRVVATPWSQKNVAEWTMLDYQNAITNKDPKYVQALEKRAASSSGDVQMVQELSQLLVLVAQMPDNGQNPDLFDARRGNRRPGQYVPFNRAGRRSEEDDEDE